MSSLASRRVAWMGLGVLLGAALVLAAFRLLGRGPQGGATGDSSEPARAHDAAKPFYHCPMHPAMVSDQPGDCPICGMRMVLRESGGAGEMASAQEVARQGESPGVPDAGRVEGFASVRIPLRKQQLIGVRTEEARTIPFVRRIGTVGRVTADESRLHHVHSKAEGWIEVMHVNAQGVKVRKGQALLAIYSPELVATQEEYLLARRARQASDGASLPETARTGDGLIDSARRRLTHFGLSAAQIEELEKTGVPSRTVTLYAPLSGYVTSRNVTQGEKIGSDTTLLDIADLSRVWIIASIYEYELPFVKTGQTATVTLSYLPGRSFQGRVSLVYPVLEEGTRTVQVRLEFDNPDLLLKPEMYADVSIQSDLGPRLGVPESAILSSGARDVVFVEQGDGFFEPREVRIGARLPDVVEILDGVSAGERVVASGTFFVDSESKLKAAFEATAPPGPGPEHRH